jgi:hypothetical protein
MGFSPRGMYLATFDQKPTFPQPVKPTALS